jgi:hypothetical protein
MGESQGGVSRDEAAASRFKGTSAALDGPRNAYAHLSREAGEVSKPPGVEARATALTAPTIPPA